jgi:subtilisin family serine protease
VSPSSVPGGGPDPQLDALTPFQWDMAQIQVPQAHKIQAGSRLVDVGILDSGIAGRTHPDFVDIDGNNVDCGRGRDFVLGVSPSPLGNPDPCTDNQFHGTHVAGTVAARANGVGIIGVAPNVTLVPVKVCDTAGFCYASSAIAGITYAGDIKLDAINMSFFVDDDEFMQSTEFKCMSDPAQRVLRKGVERAIQYARNQGVEPVAALGNSSNDLAHPPEPYENDCDVVTAETQGVVGTVALGPSSEKAFYSNYGNGRADVSAPGGNSRNPNGGPGPCPNQVLSTIPPVGYACLQGTSMASPHATGVAALIISQFGQLGTDAGEPDVVMRPTSVESYLQSTTIDLIATGQETSTKGYDYCFGNGRVDALRAVLHDTASASFVTEPCPPPQN